MNQEHFKSVGARLRQKRASLGLTQAQMAQRLNISASYLNLIEHGRRKASAQVLTQAAQALGMPQAELEHGVAPHMLEDVISAAQEMGFDEEDQKAMRQASVDSIAFARLVSQQRAHIRRLEGRLKSQFDRVSHDDVLSSALHEVLSTVTSIRSMASILRSGENLSAQWLDRFHRNIDEDGRRLADSAQELARYLSQTDQTNAAPYGPSLDHFWQEQGYYLPQIEEAHFDAAAFARDHAQHLGPDQRLRLVKVLEIMHRDACDLPLERIQEHPCKSDQDILTIAAHFRRPVASVLRRVAVLPDMPPSGLVMMDNSGAVLFSKPYLNFDPRLCWDGVCPLWPIFEALHSTSGLVSRSVTLQHGPLNKYHAQAAKDENSLFANQPYATAVMRMSPRTQTTGEEVNLGLRCRICAKSGCAARRNATIYQNEK